MDDRRQWLEERRKGLGATDIARIITGAYGGSYAVYLEKTQGAESDETEPMRIGTLLEPVLMEEAKRRWEHVSLSWRPQRGIICVTLDASIVFAEAQRGWHEPLDFKTSGDIDEWGDDGTDQVPQYVWTQLQTQILCCEAQRGHMLLLLAHRGFAFRQYEIPRDDEMCELIEQVAAKWWQDHIVEGKPPEATEDDYESAAPMLARWRPPNDPPIVKRLPPREYGRLLRDARDAYATRRFADRAATVAKARLTALAAQHNCNRIEAGSNTGVSFKSQKRRHFDVDRLKREQPDVYESYLVETEHVELDWD